MTEVTEVKRDCEAIAIPSGLRKVLPRGTTVRIAQIRGGGYTVSTEIHSMFRIDAKDADALGLAAAKVSDPEKQGPLSERLVWDTLKTVFDPEIPVNVVDLGLIYSCAIVPCDQGGKSVDVQMAMTSPGCGMSNVLKADVESKLLRLPDVSEVRVEVVFDPPWNPNRMSEAARLQLGFEFESGPKPQFTQIS